MNYYSVAMVLSIQASHLLLRRTARKRKGQQKQKGMTSTSASAATYLAQDKRGCSVRLTQATLTMNPHITDVLDSQRNPVLHNYVFLSLKVGLKCLNVYSNFKSIYKTAINSNIMINILLLSAQHWCQLQYVTQFINEPKIKLTNIGLLVICKATSFLC